MKEFFKKKIVKIILIVIAILLVAGFVFIKFNKNKMQQETNQFTYVRTVTLSKSSLQDTVVASGVIESQTTSTITSQVNNASISKINYGVGDYVKEGDVIIELDTSNLNKQISKQSEKISEQEESLQDRYDNANDTYDDAEDDYNSAKSARKTALNNFNEAVSLIANEQNAYNEADTALKQIVNECYSKATSESPCDLENYEGYNEAKSNFDNADSVLKKAKNDVNYDSLQKAYQEANNTYEQAKTKYKSAESSLEEAKKNLDAGVDSDSLDELYDNVTDYKLKAKSSGQITSINAVLGSNASGTLATIQDTSKLKISLTIDEYDILKIQLGMKATIETDANDIVYDGVVSQISPVASSGSMGSSGGFEIEVEVTSEDVSKLLIGMNAEVTIIISSGEENYNVPIDAVEDRMDGTSVIYVETGDGEFSEVVVNKGNQNGYYVEIFSDLLYDGMKVRASANADEANVTVDTSEFTGNIPGGQGGFNFDMGGSGMPNFNGGGGPGNMPGGQGGFPGGN